MKKEQQRKEGESFPDWVAHVLSHLSFKDKAIINEMIKAAWFDGLRFERDSNTKKKAMKHDELILEKICRNFARLHGFAAWKNEKNGNKGIPDSSFLHPDGRFFMVEFKKDDKQKPRPEQVLWLEKFPKTCFLISDFEAFEKLILNQKG